MSRAPNNEWPHRSSRKKNKLFRNPLTILKGKNNVAGLYDYLSDDESLPSFEELPLGIHGRRWSADFDLDDDSDSDGEHDDAFKTSGNSPSPSSYPQIHFHTTFNDDEAEESAHLPRPCTRERHLSAFRPVHAIPPPVNSSYAASYFPRGKAPLTHQNLPYPGRPYKADSDTSGTVDTDDEYDDPTYTLPKKRTICFADEQGFPLQTVYVTERDEDNDHLYHMRFVILLLNPKKKQFEFLHLTTPREERTHLSEAIKHFPDLASESSFTKQRYIGLCRPFKGGQELINSLCVQDYDLDKDEILVAIPSGMRGKQIVKMSKPLLTDRNVHKMVSTFHFISLFRNCRDKAH